MSLQTLTQTTNFTYKYADSYSFHTLNLPISGARERTEALLKTCEDDFAQLKSWFGISSDDGFGPSNRITVQVQPDSLAHNNGYRDDGTMLITADPGDSKLFGGTLIGPAPADARLADEGVRALFAAEMIEILMSYHNSKSPTPTWNPSFSDGEALSRVAAATLHPDGYYTALGGPYVNNWLQGQRANWISDPFPSDNPSDPVLGPDALDAFSCGILFIYYLWYQRDFDIRTIVQKAGATLEETYQNLTGQTVGYIPFRDLLNKYLPYDASNPNNPTNMKRLHTDNPFPILEGSAREVQLRFKEVDDPVPFSKFTRGDHGPGGHVVVSPLFTCPAKNYRYTMADRDRTLQCIASTSGFAQPRFTWTVNGLHADVGGSVNPTTTVLVDDPANPGKPKSKSEFVSLRWQAENDVSSYQEQAGELDLHNKPGDYQGHIELTIQVEVSETFGSSDAISTTALTTFDTQELVYEDAFYADQAECLARFKKIVDGYVRVSQIPLIFTLPDPPPEIRAAAQILREIITEVHAIEAKDPQLGAQLVQEVAATLQLPATVFLRSPANQIQ